MAPLVLLLVNAALACPVCTDPNDVRSAAYFDMTMFLSLLPLGVIGLGVGFVWRKYNAQVPAPR